MLAADVLGFELDSGRDEVDARGKELRREGREGVRIVCFSMRLWERRTERIRDLRSLEVMNDRYCLATLHVSS